jgi:predicted ABC-type ATPase
MASRAPTIYLIAGCNGAGKTTFAKEFLPNEVKCLRFLNADEIARGLSPLKPSEGQFRAGRMLLGEIDASLERRETFALESTLSGRTYIRLLRSARASGYEIELHYLWLSTSEQAVARVRQRVKQGGHSVAVGDIRRRFSRSLSLLLSDYLPLASRWVIWDNRGIRAEQLAISTVHDLDSVRKLISW